MKNLFSNKVLYISLGVVLLFFALACSVYAGYKQIDWRFFGADSFDMTIQPGTGHSMDPTILDGMKVTGYKVEPKVGDIIGFTCSKPECLNYQGELHSGHFMKRIIQIDNQGNWYLLGDNAAVSFDSRHYGWVAPNERSDVLVIKIK